MNNLKTQFQGYINTPSLFAEINTLVQFEIDVKDIENLDFLELDFSSKLTLGSRVEDFFRFYINQSSNFDLIQHNIQIIHDKETLGELDFIIYDKKAQKYIHVEHVYKFYLYDDSIVNEIDRYVGPNRNDTFVKKLTKLQNRQLPLLYKDETKEYLEDIDLGSCEQRLCFKGNIYLPLHLENSTIPLVNNNCIKGFYLSREKFVCDVSFHSLVYFLPDKFDWISNPSTNDTWVSFDEVIIQLDMLLQKKKSPLVWLRDQNENKTKSFFVTWWA